ncbi:SDR family NAD(P)-dependent oxidoreductase [Herbidospora sp. NBRC 101105]|uniref:SDR family NAD(P)-dependent oxidoreductase n=1 Tax=Herbidospora sp. NBRC 101105 TaxID=3032195 RepID=UPI0024A32C91|nr:SDR family NAD(P)-dependent oxidoreductase [Herbidospora sp. NBRC 101105]GLX98676.1 oxidoreductase [Herbidospora sp. NBRC 101105]
MTVKTPFGAESTASEVIEGIDLGGKRAIVTGANSGIGLETARVLADAGAEVMLAVRNVDAGIRAADEIGGKVAIAHLDLSDQTSVRDFVAGWAGPLDILVNNAGISAPPLTRTPEGWELQFATNHLGHFTLTTGLHEALAMRPGARVVVLSSVANLRSPVVFDDIHYLRREYDPMEAYGQSKTANALFAVGAAGRWAGDGIMVNAVMPGVIRTGIQRYFTEEGFQNLLDNTGRPEGKTIPQGAATSVLVATSPLLDGVTGRYFEDCNEAEPYPGTGPRRGYAPYAVDPELAMRLWYVSQEMLQT